MKFIIPNLDQLLTHPKYFVIGFFSKKHEKIHENVVEKIWDLNSKLVDRFHDYPCILGYVICRKDDGNYFNYVFLDNDKGNLVCVMSVLQVSVLFLACTCLQSGMFVNVRWPRLCPAYQKTSSPQTVVYCSLGDHSSNILGRICLETSLFPLLDVVCSECCWCKD